MDMMGTGSSTTATQIDVAGLLDGTRFLHSGEFHYFRVPRAQWRARLEQMRDVGLNGVSIYVPWNWHQPTHDVMDLTGETIPERDLIGCLEEIAAAGLTCVYRPGPFITAEWHGGGIPDWLVDKNAEIRACAASGEAAGTPGDYESITYAHPVYESAAKEWMEVALGAARPFLASNGGPIINVQLDDEPSYWDTLTRPLSGDYNPYLVTPDEGPSRYAQWLLQRHGDLAAINAAHGIEWGALEDVQPPRENMTGPEELTRFLDWHDFKIANINEHCAFLYQVTRDAGVVEPISMLFPYLMPVQARQFTRFWAERGLGDIWLTNECYLALFDSAAISEHKLGSVVATHDTFHMWRQGSAGPAITMELQGSNASWLTPGSMEMLYAATIARGIRGINYFMMIGGSNPKGYEHLSGTAYDLSAPISPDGVERLHCGVIRKLARIIDTTESILFTAEPSHDVWCGYYLPYEPAAIAGAYGGLLGAREVVEDVFFAGDMGTSTTSSVQTLMALSGVTQGSLDLETATEDELAQAGQLWIMSLDFMSEAVQSKLVRYAEGGGNLVVLPGLPTHDESGADCTVLLDAVLPDDRPDFPAIREIGSPSFSIVYGADGQVLVAPGATAALPDDDRGTVLARHRDTDAPCAKTYPVGAGTITVLGFRLKYNPTEESDHQDFLISIVENAVGPRTAWTSSTQATAMQLSGPDGGLVCVVNPTPLSATTAVHWTPDENADGIRATFPTEIDGITLDTLGARLLPIQRRLLNGALLQYATWELLAEHPTNAGTELVFDAPATGEGELRLVGDSLVVEVSGGELVRTVDQPDGVIAVINPTHAEVTVQVTASGTSR